MYQVPKASKSSDASATSGASMSTTATATATAPAVPPSASKKVPDTPTRAAPTTAAQPAAISATIPPASAAAPPTVAHLRMSIDSTASQRSTTESGARSPDTSSLKRLHNVTSPARADLPPPSAAVPQVRPQVEDRSLDKPSVPVTVSSAEKLPRSSAKLQLSGQHDLYSHQQGNSHASSLPVPQQLEVSFDRSVGTASSAAPTVNGNDRAQNVTSAAAPSSAHMARRSHVNTDAAAGVDHTNDEGHSSSQRAHAEESEPYAGLRQALKPVTAKDLEESLQLLRYDIHREVQDVIREQIRQFSIAKVIRIKQ